MPEQIARLGIVVAILLAVTLALRFAVIPASFFSRELHRSSTVERELANPIRFAGTTACRSCHEEHYETKYRGKHRGLACETCHGPSTAHTENPAEVKPYAPRDRTFCPVCHAYDPSRPTGFPQINPATHNPSVACITCHQPHEPEPPEVPRDCSACHGQIARTKAVSSHARLACTTCHTVDERHKVTPRAALPTKPETREFCGQCHASGSSGPARRIEAPRSNKIHFSFSSCLIETSRSPAKRCFLPTTSTSSSSKSSTTCSTGE